ncbi:hypothetical protein J6Y50_01265 [bacterium]|nr:hypothetical protein [bacterium]
MKKIVFILICFSAALIISCGDSGSSEKCESSFDCPIGKVCSNGMCVSEGSADDGSGDGSNGEIPDEGNGGGSNGGSSGNHDGGDTAPDDDSDSATDPEDITGTCEPGKTQKCGYQGPAGTEDVGPCKAATRTCKEDGTWGKCEGAVEPVYESGEELCTNGIDDDCDGKVDNGTEEGGCAYWNNTEVPDADADADVDPGIIDVGYTGDYDDAYQLPVDVEICNDSCIPMKADCFPSDINEGESGLCNQVDDDCDGIVDEGCSCTAGQTQPCFLGPKNFRGVGTCHDGVQTCKVTMRAGSTGVWGECMGGISPKQDVCDNADNNCNGCDDDKLCCAPPINCAYDLTADGDFLPFKYKIIDGKQIYDTGHKFNDADTATWEWTLTKGPCDIVLNKVNSFVKGGKTLAEVGDINTDNGTQNTIVSGVGFSQFKVKFKLSGNYKLHLKVTRENGEVYECEWVITVVSEGLRIELCWDRNTAVDADLHVGKNGTTTRWSNGQIAKNYEIDACYFYNCKYSASDGPHWGYDTTMNYDKDGKGPKEMRNPRLDMDNVMAGPYPENINIDNPNDGDTFRVGVYWWSGTAGVTRPVINIYCGGTLRATYGGYVSDSGDSFVYQVENFDSNHDFWKVVEVQWVGDYSSDGCILTPKLDSNGAYMVKDSIDYPFNYTEW